MASISTRSGRGGPQIEALRESRDLRAAVSPQSIYSYDGKRSDYVERPQWGENGWERLAAALSQFNPHLSRMTAAKNEQFREEQIAIGRRLMHENKVAWSEFIRDNPEYAGLNPHLERGYKGAELAAKSQNYHAALQDFYTTSRFMNETDPEKVRAAISTFTKDWTTENITEQYEPELYSENFLKAVESSEGALMNRHTNDRAEEHVKLAVEKHGQLFATTIDSILDNTPNISDPKVFSGALDTIASHAMNQMRVMEESGVPRSLATAVMEDAIINLAKAEGMEGNGEEILALAKKIQTGSGVIGGKPGFQAKERSLRDEWDKERRQKNSEYIQMWHFNKAKAQEGATATIGNALLSAYKNREPIPDAVTLMSLPGVGPEHLDVANQARNNFLGLTTHKPVMDQKAQVEFAIDRHLARTGVMSPARVLERLGAYGLDKGMELYDIAVKAVDGGDAASIALRSSGFAAATASLEAQITATAPAGVQSEILKARVVEAKEALADMVSAYVQDGERKNSPRTNEEIRVYAREQALKLGAEPLFREFDTARDIVNPETYQRMKSPEHWSGNTKRYFDTPQSAGDMVWAYVRSEAETAQDLQAKYGIPPEMVNNFIVNQARLYNIDLAGVIQQHLEALRKEEERKKAREEYDPFGYTYGVYP